MYNLPNDSLGSKSRKKEYQLPRNVVSVIARMQDNTRHNVIANIINRDRTNVYYYEKMHKSNYRESEQYRDMFNNIWKAYVDIPKFANKTHLITHLKSHGIKNSKNYQVIIKIKSGNCTVNVRVNYRDFYKQLDLCKFALKDYKYDLDILHK